MSQSTIIILAIITITVSTTFIASRTQKRWRKILIISIGILAAGIIASTSAILFRIKSPAIPSDVEVLALLYGSDVDVQESTDGKVYILEQLSEAEKEQLHYVNQVYTQIIHMQSGWDQTPTKILILTRTGPPDCCEQSFRPFLGGAVISWRDGAWKVESHRERIALLHSFMFIAEGEFIKIGSNQNGFQFQDSDTQNGGTQTWDLIITTMDNNLKLIATIETSANNADQCPPTTDREPCWAYQTNYKFVTGDHPDYHDILVTTSGTKLMNSKVVPINETEKYVFTDNEYQLEK